jgi:hypothetical protein
MTSIMKATDLFRTCGQQSLEGWMTATGDSTYWGDSGATGNATSSASIKFDDFADLLDWDQSREHENVPTDQWDAFMVTSGGMLAPMQGCLPFVWR